MRATVDRTRCLALAFAGYALLAIGGSQAQGEPILDRSGRAGDKVAYDLTSLLRPDRPWLTQADRPLTAADFRDKIVIVDLVTPKCPSLCVVRALDIAAVVAKLPDPVRARVRVVAISLAPGDGPSAMQAFGEGLHLDAPLWTLVTSDAEGARHTIRALAVIPPGAPMPRADEEPPSSLFLFDRRGRLMQRYSGRPVDRVRLVREIQALDTYDDTISGATGRR